MSIYESSKPDDRFESVMMGVIAGVLVLLALWCGVGAVVIAQIHG